MVDDKAGVIVAVEVSNQENDAGLAVPLVQQAEQNCGSQADAAVADSGYGSGPEIAQAAQSGVNLLVRPVGDSVAETKTYHAYNFAFEPERDRVICPQGKDLNFARNMNQKGQIVRIFRCDHHDCPVRAECTKDQRSRRLIEIWSHTSAVQAMRAKIKQPQAAAQLRKRRQLIERVFGHIKQHESWRRWTVRGLEGVKTQWALLCCAFNLRLLYQNRRARAA